MITDWSPFFTAQTGAFAALTGLVFVALSINLKEILASPGLPGRAGQAGDRDRGLGGGHHHLGEGSPRAAPTSGQQDSHAHRPGPDRHPALVVPAALLTTGNSSGLYWEVAGTGFCLVAGMTDAWVLLCEGLR